MNTFFFSVNAFLGITLCCSFGQCAIYEVHLTPYKPCWTGLKNCISIEKACILSLLKLTFLTCNWFLGSNWLLLIRGKWVYETLSIFSISYPNLPAAKLKLLHCMGDYSVHVRLWKRKFCIYTSVIHVVFSYRTCTVIPVHVLYIRAESFRIIKYSNIRPSVQSNIGILGCTDQQIVDELIHWNNAHNCQLKWL